ncbi:MAG: peroxiredoxin [Micrococcales bacterium]|nr:peroxiredoxin [Micrococcales bacterium]
MPRLSIGDLAPDFTLPAADGDRFTLSQMRGSHMIVYFYPAAGTPGCTLEATNFRDSSDALTAAGYSLVGISPDTPVRLAKFAADEHLRFPLLADEDHAVLVGWGAWGKKTLYGRTTTGVIRSTVVVDPTGHVEVAQYNVRATGHVPRLMRDLGLQ